MLQRGAIPRMEAVKNPALEAALKKERKANSPWKRFKRNKVALLGMYVVMLLFILAVFAPLIAPFNPNEMKLTASCLKPGTSGHLLGTDEFGRDLLSRIIYGSQISLIVGLLATGLGALIGIIVGLISGYYEGVWDSITMRIMDGMFAFPFVLLAIVLMTALGSGLHNVVLAIGIANIPGFARIVRGQVLIVKREEYCEAVRSLGASSFHLILHHILPNILSPVIVYSSLNIAGAIISEAALSFLGLGIQPPTASWGNILRTGKDYLLTAPHISTYSGLAILITVIGFNLFGDGIRDAFDPKLKH
jgi:peptide/nickel transport system permease protein